MSASKELRHKQQDSKRKSGVQKYAKRNTAAAGNTIGWDEVDAVTVARLVAAITNAGDAVMFGRTSDGGALVLNIMSGSDRVKEYYSDPEQALSAIMELAALAEA